MEYIYAVMLLNKVKKDINDANITAVLKAAGVDVDAAKVKSVIAALDGVDIEDVIANSSVATTSAAPASSSDSASSQAAPAQEKKEEKKAPAADAAAGLGSLF